MRNASLQAQMQNKSSKEEIARRYAVSLRTVSNWMRARRISYLKLGRLVRFDAEQVDRELSLAGLVRSSQKK